MKLISLEVKVDGIPRRVVEFKEGLNLITNKKGVGRSGNRVGKSTLSRVVDFIFLGSIDPIYIDEEFKKPNSEIELFFKNHDVNAELSFLGVDGKTHQLKRNLNILSKDLFWFDGEKVDKDIYESIIQKFCFNIVTKRPTVRKVIPKFIRNDSHKMLNTTKFLDQWSGKKEYGEIFLYLFGFNNGQLLTEKQEISNLLGRRKRNSTSINALVNEQKPQVEIKKHLKEAAELEIDLLKFDYSPEYDNPVERLTTLQIKEDDYLSLLMSIERKLSNIDKTVNMLERHGDLYLVEQLKVIYDYAGVKMDGAIMEFANVLSFHKNLVNKKRQYLTIDLPSLQEKKLELESELTVVGREKLNVFSDMKSAESISNITTKLKKLGELKVGLGKLEGLLDQQKKASEDFNLAENQLSEILEKISAEIKNIYEFESLLNTHFKVLTKLIHDDEYGFSLNYNEATGDCNIEVINVVTNPEGGKKKAEVIAFDLAYIYAVHESGNKRPKFVFHDSIEDIDSNQIEVIFREANKIPGQQIISMLSDKINKEIYEAYEPSIILLLDEDSKFFGI